MSLLGGDCPHSSLCKRWNINFFFFTLSSVLCVRFLRTAGLSSQLVSNPCGDVLLCCCENSLCYSKAEEADIKNKWDAAKRKKKAICEVKTS